MDKRFFLALVLTGAVVIGVPMLFRPLPVPPSPDAPATDVRTATEAPVPAPAAPAATTPAPTIEPAAALPAADTVAAPTAPTLAVAETTEVVTPLATYRFSSVGAAIVSAEMQRHRSLRPGEDARPVELARDGDPLLSYRIIVPGDTIALAGTSFEMTRGEPVGDAPAPVLYRALVDGMEVAVRYTFAPDSYKIHTSAEVRNVPGRGYLLLDLAHGLRSGEANLVDDLSHMAYVYKPQRRDASSIGFSKLDPGETRLVSDPLDWVALKSKYFVVGLLGPAEAGAGAPGFAELQVTGGTRTERVASNASGTVVTPIDAGALTFTIYAGPQEWRRLVAVGRDFHNVNPYGGFMQGMIQPFAQIVMRMLLWLRDTTQLNYGWVLVIFGVVVRLIMWPLNQKAMRATIKMQRIQPELQAAQKKYPKDPQKQQQEIMRVYKEHGMNPFSSLAGCLPMLLPMPILFALFFVFQNTIEFRGVPFAYLADISLKDPYYILPVLMGITTFLVSWIGLRGAPPNPQAKMIAYVMPLALVFILANMAAGLNLYYTVQNLAAIPQQWLIARERMKATPPKPGATPPTSTPHKPVVQGTPSKGTPAKGSRRARA